MLELEVHSSTSPARAGKHSFEVPEHVRRAHGVEIFRDVSDDQIARPVPEFGAKQAEKVRLGNENDALHTLCGSAFLEQLGEVVREAQGGAFVTRPATIRRVASLRVTVETPLWPCFQIAVFDAACRMIDAPKKTELLPSVLEKSSTNAIRNQDPS